MLFYLALIISLAGCLYFLWSKLTERKDEQKAQRLAFIRSNLPDIRNAVGRFFSRLNNSDKGYFTNHELTIWKNAASQWYDQVNDQPYDRIGLDAAEIDELGSFLNYYRNGESLRGQYNQAFVAQELTNYSQFFDSVENRKLDIQQRKAIVTDEDNSLVIAGAGSGKTTTIVGKVGYVLSRYKVPPEQVLLISFTSKSASDLAGRVNIPGVDAKTFHRFGKDVITDVEQRQPTIFDEKQYNRLISGFFEELVQQPAYLKLLTTYFTDFLKQPKQQDEFNNQGEYFQYLKDENFSTYNVKEVPFQGRTTLKREVVKSIEECKIANFLLFAGINYEYEYPYEHDTATEKYRQYKPDFTIHWNGRKVYLEHLAINKNGIVPHFFADASKGQTHEQATKLYVDGLKWKQELHKRHGTILIETYSHEMFDNVLFENLAKKLIAAGVEVNPKSSGEIWEIISKAAKDEVDSLINLFQTFITLMKSNNYSIDDVKERNKRIKGRFFQERNIAFIEIITPIYQMYENYLAERKEIDFSDMINKAAGYVGAGKYKRKLKYVIVDEFQDISIGRYQLVKAIKDANPGCKLFCVGDDWQSIYRFSGSDIALFRDFEKYFGYSEKAKIETTYRFRNPLIDLSSSFILKNPSQTKKELKALDNTKTSEYRITYSDSGDQDDTQALQSIFDELEHSGKAVDREILILGRYTFDIDRIKNMQKAFQIDKAKGVINYSTRRSNGETISVSARFLTVHKSKGLEADVVIVINCNSGAHGFPSGTSDDPVMNLLLSDADQYENGEERRLFYVAMTRAREIVYFVAERSYKSKFIAELEVGEDKPAKKCPKCITADLVKRSGVKNGKAWAFYGCSNFMYGCKHQEWQ